MRDSLRNADFRRLFLGRLVTNAGDSLYSVAAMWLVYDLSGSTAYTGLAGFLVFAPQVLQLFVGPLVDRWPLRRILVGTQLLQAVLVLVIPVAWWAGALSAELVLVVMPLLSLLNQFVYPAQAAALPRLVSKEQLVGANSALSLAYQGTDLAFNALSGVLVAAVGAVSLYLVDSVTFVVAAALFFGIRLPSAREESAAAAAAEGPAVADGGDDPTDSGYLTDLREGVSFVRKTVLLQLLVPGIVANFAFGATLAVLPAFADALGGSAVYGGLMAALAGGSLVGSVVASRLSGVAYGRLSITGFALGGAIWLAAVGVDWTPGTVALFALAFVPVGVTNVIASALIQSMVPDDLLGRVSAVSTSINVSMTPLGALLGGVAAESLGAATVVAGGGLGMLFIAAYALAVPALRRLPAVSEVETLTV